MNRWVAIAAVVGVFLTGFLVGLLATHLVYARLLRQPGAPPELASRFFARSLEGRLQLTPEQSAEIEEILDRSRHRAAELRQEMRPVVMGLMQETWRQVGEVLTPEQRVELERLRRRHRRGFEQFLLGPPGHPSGPPGPGPHGRGLRRQPRTPVP